MSPINDKAFCQDCFGHISTARNILRECHDSPCSADHYERIGFQFTVLMSEAQAGRQGVLTTYAQAMASYARHLSNKDTAQISQTDLDLLRDGIAAGLGCQQGARTDNCVAQNFDHLWPFIAELRARIDPAETMQA